MLKHFKDSGVDVLFIPGGCTGLVQVMDVWVNSVFKASVRNKYIKWRAEKIQVCYCLLSLASWHLAASHNPMVTAPPVS